MTCSPWTIESAKAAMVEFVRVQGRRPLSYEFDISLVLPGRKVIRRLFGFSPGRLADELELPATRPARLGRPGSRPPKSTVSPEPVDEGGRYYVVAVTGFNTTGSAEAARRPATSYSVLDRYDCHREVGGFYAGGLDARDSTRRRRALELMRRLNSENRDDG